MCSADLPKLTHIAAQTESYDLSTDLYHLFAISARHNVASAHAGLDWQLSQWVFDRGILCNQHGLMAVIISAEGAHQLLTQDELALRVAQELQAAFPQLQKPLWHKVIAEKRATFSCNVNLPRPAHVNALPAAIFGGRLHLCRLPRHHRRRGA